MFLSVTQSFLCPIINCTALIISIPQKSFYYSYFIQRAKVAVNDAQ